MENVITSTLLPDDNMLMNNAFHNLLNRIYIVYEMSVSMMIAKLCTIIEVISSFN